MCDKSAIKLLYDETSTHSIVVGEVQSNLEEGKWWLTSDTLNTTIVFVEVQNNQRGRHGKEHALVIEIDALRPLSLVGDTYEHGTSGGR
jgi:hypothetical protein